MYKQSKFTGISPFLYDIGTKITSKLGPLGKAIENNSGVVNNALLGGVSGAILDGGFNESSTAGSTALSALLGAIGAGGATKGYHAYNMRQAINPDNVLKMRNFARGRV